MERFLQRFLNSLAAVRVAMMISAAPAFDGLNNLVIGLDATFTAAVISFSSAAAEHPLG